MMNRCHIYNNRWTTVPIRCSGISQWYTNTKLYKHQSKLIYTQLHIINHANINSSTLFLWKLDGLPRQTVNICLQQKGTFLMRHFYQNLVSLWPFHLKIKPA